MTFIIKFKFILKSGAKFECTEELKAEQFLKVVETVKNCMRDGIEGIVRFDDCCVRLSDCSVVEWEEIGAKENE